jgi:uncharacterized membrane protein
MDERKLPKPKPEIIESVDLEREAQPGTDSAVAFFGDPARVREGFAIALHAMGIGVSTTDEGECDACEEGD